MGDQDRQDAPGVRRGECARWPIALVRRHLRRTRVRARLVSGWRDAGAAYEVSWKTVGRSASRKSCRAVSRSTMRMGAPQRGHGHDGRGV